MVWWKIGRDKKMVVAAGKRNRELRFRARNGGGGMITINVSLAEMCQNFYQSH